MLSTLISDSMIALPILWWAGIGILLVTLRCFLSSQKVFLFLTLALLGMGLVMSWNAVGTATQTIFAGTAIWDHTAQLFTLLTYLISIGVVLMLVPGMASQDSTFSDAYSQLPEFLICLVFSSFGVSVLAASYDLTSLFLGLETLSIGTYCLCGFYRKELRSTESAFKYLMIGAFSTAIFLYGIAFVYGVTGATQFEAIQTALSQHSSSPLALLAVLFLMAGLAFKFALAPFHLYTADVYEGAPTPVTAYMATIVKVGAVAVGVRVLWGFLDSLSLFWEPLWLALSTLSILVGNIGALQQQTLKRLLAFSSVSHAGFLGLALIANGAGGKDAFPLVSYLFVYCAMSLGAFAVVSLLEDRSKPFRLEDLKGLCQTKFWPAVALAIFLLGMAGIPPFAGFLIKFWVFQGLIESGQWPVALIAVVGSVIGAAYYLRLLIYMFVSEDRGAAAKWPGLTDRAFLVRLVIIATLAVTVLGSIRPSLYADWILAALAVK